MVKKGKSENKEKVKKSKKSRQKPTVNEAILTYQINLREKSLDDVLFEMRILEDENEKKRALNESMKREQERLVRSLLTSTKVIINEKLEKEQVGRDSVVSALQLNTDIADSNKRQIDKINEEILNVEARMIEEKKCFEYWKEYEVRGQEVAKNKISLLEQELVDREVTFKSMTGEMIKKLTKAKETIEEITAETLTQQKSIAIKKAVSKMERFTRQDIVDNMWLHKELDKCRQETSDLLETIRKLEEENMKLLSSLYNCQAEDLQLTRQRFADKIKTEELALSNLMEIDLSQLSFQP